MLQILWYFVRIPFSDKQKVISNDNNQIEDSSFPLTRLPVDRSGYTELIRFHPARSVFYMGHMVSIIFIDL